MPPISSPENVLKRAEELVSMEKPSAALELLYDTILSKRTRNVSLTFLEPIVLRFVELSVDLRKGKIVKDGLHQYKKLVVPTSVPSLQAVVDKLLVLAEEKVTCAQEKADQITVDDEDLEAEQSPEDLLMSTVSSEQTKDRTDRELVTPWLKFLWEAYRSVLDVLRNSSKLETLYSEVVTQAFQFCLRYQRKTEFRRLCDLLRNHLQMAAQQSKLPNQTNPVDLTDPDTLQLFLDTRFEQLGVAVKLELWQEAFRSVEDVHTLLTASRRPIKLANMASYYETLARIFAVGNNHLFHAAAWSKYYSMVYHTRHSAPEGELERIASYFLLSVLCIPSSNREDVVESRSHRLSTLLNLTQVPTRELLMQSAMAKNVLQYVRPEIKELYLVLETNFHPLLLKERLEPIFEVVGKVKAYQSYVQPLLKVVMGRLFKQLSQVYTTTRLEQIVELATFPAPFNLSRFDIEQELVLGAHANHSYRIRIDHEQGSVTFLDSLSECGNNYGNQILEETPSDLISQQLRKLAVCLNEVLPQVDSRVASSAASEHASIVSNAQRSLADENEKFLSRRKLQEERSAEAKKQQQEREAAAAKERADRLAAERAAEEQRLLNEAREREEERIRRERQAIQDEQKRALAEEINARGIIKVDMENLDNVDNETLRRMQIEQLERDDQELRGRMTAVARRHDHLERAYRKEEAAIWIADGKEQESRDREAYEERKKLLIESAKARAAQNSILRERYARMAGAFDKYMEGVNERRHAIYLEKKAKNDALLAQAKEARREQVLKEREAAAEKARLEAEEQARMAAERTEREKRIVEEREKMAAERARRAVDSPRSTPEPAARSSPFGNARPAGAAKPVSSPFGNARPVEVSKPASSPFGNAKPVSSSPFGNAKPVSKSPFGNARPSPTGAGGAPRSSPFGSAKPVEGRSNPFGNAKPADTGNSSNSSSTSRPSGGAYRPPSRR